MVKDKKKVDFKKNLKLYKTLAMPYKKLFVLTVFFVFIVSFALVMERYIFKELIDKGTLYTSGLITQDAFVNIIFTLASAFILLGTIHVSSDWFRFHIVNRLERELIYDLKRKFYNHILELSHSFHSTHRPGSLIARLTRGARAIEGVTDFFLFETLTLGIEFIIIIIAILFFDVATAIVMALMGIAFITYSTFLLLKQQQKLVGFNKAEDTEKAHISDSMMNIETIKYFAKHEYMQKKYSTISRDVVSRQMEVWDYARWMVSGHGIIFIVALIGLLYFPLIKLINGEITIGTIAFIYTIYLGLTGPLGRFTWHLRSFFNSIADLDSLSFYTELENEIKDKSDAKELKVKLGEIEFDNVSFKYKNRYIIKNMSLKIAPNEKIALVGHSGSGKTTIVKLLYRLYNLNKGKIIIDGKDITNLKQESLRGEMSIVPQEGILFNDTIENNIKFSKPNATKKEVFSALKKAQFYSFVKSIPEKENTFVGERGIKLSGGEKQRLSIARAILANKKILVLDEATSALDSKTERDIQKALNKLMEGRTAIIIAHRLSTIMHADKIVVMNKGKIVQIGKHNELIRQNGIYKELWKLQKGGYIE